MSEPIVPKDARGILTSKGPDALRAATMNASVVDLTTSLPPKTPKTPKSGASSSLLGAYGSFGSEGCPENESLESAPFPIDALPPIVRRMVQETSRVTQTPDAMGAIVALGILSASLGGGLLVRSGGGRITPANLFLLGIARSGTGKSRAFNLIAKPFFDVERETLLRWIENERPRIETSLRIATKRAEAKEKEASKEPDADARRMLTQELQTLVEEKQHLERELVSQPCFSVADVTREKLSQALSVQPGEALASLSADARGIIGVVMGRYTNGKASDEDIYLSGYSGDPLRVDRLSRPPVVLNAPRLSLVWLIQPDAARTLGEDERMTESGLIPRLLLCDVNAEAQDEPENFPEMAPDVADEWQALVRELLNEYREGGDAPQTIDSTLEAREVLRAFTNECRSRIRSGGDLRDVDSYVARWGENAWRMALCFHAARHHTVAGLHPLRPEEAAAAVEVVRWFSRAQLDFLSVSRADKAKRRLDRVIEILRLSGGSETLRNLRKSNGFEEEELRSLAERFPALLQIEIQKTGGRDRIVACIPEFKPRQL